MHVTRRRILKRVNGQKDEVCLPSSSHELGIVLSFHIRNCWYQVVFCVLFFLKSLQMWQLYTVRLLNDSPNIHPYIKWCNAFQPSWCQKFTWQRRASTCVWRWKVESLPGVLFLKMGERCRAGCPLSTDLSTATVQVIKCSNLHRKYSEGSCGEDIINKICSWIWKGLLTKEFYARQQRRRLKLWPRKHLPVWPKVINTKLKYFLFFVKPPNSVTDF